MVKNERVKTPLGEGDELLDEADVDADGNPRESPLQDEDDDYVNEESWVRVNDKAPIWMRCVSRGCSDGDGPPIRDRR